MLIEALMLNLEGAIMTLQTMELITKIEVLMVEYLGNKIHMKLVLGVASVSIKLSKV